jgi:hypothetical protein
MKEQRVNLNMPVHADSAPVVVRAVVDGKVTLTEVGPVEGSPRAEEYVLFSALPDELKERVKLAVQHIIRGG